MSEYWDRVDKVNDPSKVRPLPILHEYWEQPLSWATLGGPPEMTRPPWTRRSLAMPTVVPLANSDAPEGVSGE